MEFCGLDISKRRIGISIAHVYGNEVDGIINKILLPYKVINPLDFVTFILDMKKKYSAVKFVIGLPNRRYENFIKVKTFAHKHRSLLQPFYFQDEEFSTMVIDNEFDRKNHKPNDDLAASVILENFLKNKTYKDLQNILNE